MRDSDWAILDELYRNPNVSSAARALYMSQPTLTKRIQHMETEFNVQIAERTPHGLNLTPEGAYLCQRAASYLAFAENTKRGLEAIKRDGNHVINLGSSYTFNRYNLWDILSDYNKVDDLACFDVVNNLSQELFQMLVDDKVDAVFVRGDYEGPVEKVHIERAQGYIVSKNPVTPEDLHDMRRIGYRTSPCTEEILGKWWDEHFDEDIPSAMIIGYLGFAWKPIANNENSYTLCFLSDKFENSLNLHLTPLFYVDGSPVVRDSWFMYQKDKKMSEYFESFANYIKENVAIHTD